MLPHFLKNASAAALMGAGLSLAFATPSQAGVSCRAFGETVFNGTYTCLAGDKLYSAFEILLDEGNRLLDTTFTISDNDPTHSLTVSGSFIPNPNQTDPGVYEFTYRMEIIDAAKPFRSFALLATSATSSAVPTADNFFTKTLTADYTIPQAGTTGTVLADFPGGPNPSDTAFFDEGVKSAFFTSTLQVVSGVAQTITDDVTQEILTPPRVPGPLPILGAAAAFGFSRKLRRRVNRLA